MAGTDSQRTPGRELVLAAVDNAESSDRLMKAAVERSFQPNLISGKSRDWLAKQTTPLLSRVRPHQVSHNVLRRIERSRLSVRKSISFTAQMHQMSEARHLGVLRPSWKLDVKNNAYHFVDLLGVRRPKSDKETYKWADTPKSFPSVIKATRATGSRGCYLLYGPDHIVHARDSQVFSDIGAMEAHAQELMGSQRNPLPDRWMVEELVLEDSAKGLPARDLKFYVFYGEVALIQESRRDSGLKVAFWNPDGSKTVTGRYEDVPLDGLGFTRSDVETVSEVSRAIPYPFMRIDMLKGENELVLGEFTPRAGSFDQFNDEWDRRLGEAWVRAESRLLEDLLRGKQFDAYLNSTGLLEGINPVNSAE